jgi:glycosyltransferase involved in cell wall biosynthesis
VDASHPPVTVVTVTRNARVALEGTIASVLAQTYRPLDYLVVDGASTDGTLDLLARHGPPLRWVSERDEGIYDAMNRALARIDRPDAYVFFLNADDRFVDPEAIARVMAAADGADFVHCRLELRDDELGDRDVVGEPLALRDLALQNRCGHQMIFCRRRVFDLVGAFDLAYPIAADYDWVVRVFQDDRIAVRFVPEVAASMAAGGVSQRRYVALLRERQRVVRARFGPGAAARFAAYRALVETPSLGARRALRALGLLKAARAVRRALRAGSAHPAPRA